MERLPILIKFKLVFTWIPQTQIQKNLYQRIRAKHTNENPYKINCMCFQGSSKCEHNSNPYRNIESHSESLSESKRSGMNTPFGLDYPKFA